MPGFPSSTVVCHSRRFQHSAMVELPGVWEAVVKVARETRADPFLGAALGSLRPFNEFRANLKKAGLTVSSEQASQAWVESAGPCRPEPASRAAAASLRPTFAGKEDEEEELIRDSTYNATARAKRIQFGQELEASFLQPIAEEETLSEFEERLSLGMQACNVPEEAGDVALACKILHARAVFSQDMEKQMYPPSAAESIVRGMRRREDETPETLFCRFMAGLTYLHEHGIVLDEGPQVLCSGGIPSRARARRAGMR